jgi:hypothetical protein
LGASSAVSIAARWGADTGIESAIVSSCLKEDKTCNKT